MNKKTLATLALALTASCTALTTSHAANLLLNGNFESAVLSANGNHIGSTPDSWIISAFGTTTFTQTTSLSNFVRGTATGSGTPAPSLPAYPGDGGAQSEDGDGANVLVSQTFTPTVTDPVNVQMAIGGRDKGSGTATGSFWQILNASTNAVVASLSTANIKPGEGLWVLSNTNTSVFLTAGITYRFVISLDDTAQVDAASITSVPEPSTVAFLVAGGLFGIVGLRRLQRRRLS